MKLSEFLTRVGPVEQMRDGYLAHCPAHADSHPSLRIGVSADKVLLKCRAGCKTEVVLKALDMTLRDLARMEVDEVAAPPSRATSTDAPASSGAVAALAVELDRYAEAIFTESGAATLAYAKDRFGLSDDDVRRLGLGYWRDRDTDRLVVPFRDTRGVARGFQARALDKDAKVRWKGPRSPEDGGSWAKWGYFQGEAGWNEVIVCEGPGDGLTAVSLGYDAIFVRGAALATNEDVIEAIADIAGSRKVVIAGDGDSAGWDFSANLTAALAARDVSVAVLAVPEEEDLTSWRAKVGDAAIVRAVNESQVAVTTHVMGRELDEERYSLDDAGAARWLRDYIRRQGHDVRWTPEAGYFIYSEGKWEKDELDRVRAFAQDAFEDMRIRAEAYLDAAIREDNQDARAAAMRRKQYAQRYRNTRHMNDALTQLKALRDVATRIDEFDRNPHLLAAKNGVIDLRTGELLPHSAAYMLTRRIEFDYNPTARAPRWERYLEEVFPNHPDLPAYMQRLVGYGITGNTDEQCFVILWGTGANGKSVFTETLTEVFRDITVTTPFSTFESKPSGAVPNDVAALKGARLVMASEGEADKPMAEAILKRVTGRDRIPARFMRQEYFEFRPTFLLFLASNTKPRFKGQDEGLWRRVKLIPWERYFAPHERDHYLDRKLLAEGEGILAWAVRGAVEWYRSGLRDPGCVIEATAEYRENSNALAGFLPGIYVKGDPTDAVPLSELYSDYLNWTDEENLQNREIWTRTLFVRALEERGFQRRRRAKGYVIVGIRKAGPQDAEPDREQPEPDWRKSSVKRTSTRVGGASLDDL